LGSDSETKPGYITARDAEAWSKADFTAAPTSGTAPLAVEFTDISTGDIETWYWTFGDGETSTEQHPTHTYTESDVYTVILTVDGPTGSDTEIKPGYINVLSGIHTYLPLTMK
jgi:PKD repeat protein